ncbi:LysE family transporter [Ramlibacter sp. H39-3-26]|uniref:LysE/ArgO family amino acid transporter n=1 Tax=Curvibacter soli TaxID=3031331 RepID=UPI0023DAFF4B|nr:LysE family transporter [Ramlibacter sp. H39-3-26]MDF1484317.1 LysE family transporter [Ramlibacter sp. H39-3-26]
MPLPPSSFLSAWSAGFAVCLSLIVAIGAQNLMVLRQGLLRRHVGASVAFCTVADVTLALCGVAGVARVLEGRADWAAWLSAAGGMFLLGYGALALRRAWRGGSAAMADGAGTARLRTVLAQLAAFTLLNPHVYFDTLVIIGPLGARQPGVLKGVFVAGVGSASLLWFAALGYGARVLRPWFARPAAWRVLDAATGGMMLGLAAWLMAGARL